MIATLPDAAVTLARWRAHRAEVAQAARELRAMRNPSRFRGIIERSVADCQRKFPVRYSALRARSRQLLAWSRTPVRTMGSEYYSACGAEDGAYEARREAAEEAERLAMLAAFVRQTRA